MTSRRLAYLLKVLAIFTALGPLIGLVVFALGVGCLALINGKPDGLWFVPMVLLYGIVFAHFMGAPWAALAGAAAALLAMWTGERRTSIGLAAGALSFTGALATGAIFVPSELRLRDGVTLDGFGWDFAAVTALVHIVSAWLCWAMARRMAVPGAPRET